MSLEPNMSLPLLLLNSIKSPPIQLTQPSSYSHGEGHGVPGEDVIATVDMLAIDTQSTLGVIETRSSLKIYRLTGRRLLIIYPWTSTQELDDPLDHVHRRN